MGQRKGSVDTKKFPNVITGTAYYLLLSTHQPIVRLEWMDRMESCDTLNNSIAWIL